MSIDPGSVDPRLQNRRKQATTTTSLLEPTTSTATSLHPSASSALPVTILRQENRPCQWATSATEHTPDDISRASEYVRWNPPSKKARHAHYKVFLNLHGKEFRQFRKDIAEFMSRNFDFINGQNLFMHDFNKTRSPEFVNCLGRMFLTAFNKYEQPLRKPAGRPPGDYVSHLHQCIYDFIKLEKGQNKKLRTISRQTRSDTPLAHSATILSVDPEYSPSATESIGQHFVRQTTADYGSPTDTSATTPSTGSPSLPLSPATCIPLSRPNFTSTPGAGYYHGPHASDGYRQVCDEAASQDPNVHQRSIQAYRGSLSDDNLERCHIPLILLADELFRVSG